MPGKTTGTQSPQSPKHFLLLYLKGAAMGVADLVPGVSGGTIALISGIYDKFISLLARIDINFFIYILRFRLSALQQEYEILFLITLGIGILSGIAAGAGVVHYGLENYPPIVYSLFAGIICSSAINLIKLDNIKSIFFWGGIILAVALIFWLEVNLAWTPLNIFIAGGLAICAMLLPGISGSFILLLIGLYELMIEALIGLDISSIALFMAGALIMLFSFSKIIMLGLHNYQTQTMSIMLGLMLGALPKLWPWQNEELELLSPINYSNEIGGAYLPASLLAATMGFLLIPSLRYLSKKFMN